MFPGKAPGTVANPTLFAPPPDHYLVSPFFVLQHSLPAVHLGSVYQLVIRLPCLHICSFSVWLRYCASASSVSPSTLPAALRSHSSTLDGSFSPYVVFPKRGYVPRYTVDVVPSYIRLLLLYHLSYVSYHVCPHQMCLPFFEGGGLSFGVEEGKKGEGAGRCKSSIMCRTCLCCALVCPGLSLERVLLVIEHGQRSM